MRRLVPELVPRDARGLLEAVAVLGQGELADPAITRGGGVHGDPLVGHPARPELLVIGREMAVVVEEH